MYPVWSRGGRFYKKQSCEPTFSHARPMPYSHGNFQPKPQPQSFSPRPMPSVAQQVYPTEPAFYAATPRGRGQASRGRGLVATQNESEHRVPTPPTNISVPRPWEGSLVEYVFENKTQLVLLTEPVDCQGRSWRAVTRGNDSVLVSLATVSFHWPQQYLGQSYRYGLEDLVRLGDLCSSLVGSYKDHIKIAWGSYVDRGISKITSDMFACFLFGSFPKPHELYVAHLLLGAEEVYFTRNGIDEASRTPAYRCRTLQEVSRLERERKQQRMYKENLESFRQAVSSVLSDSKQAEKFKDKWRSPPYQVYIDKLTQMALSLDAAVGDGDINQDILQPLGVKPTSKDVFNLLVSIGIFKKYQNLNVLRHPRSLDMTPAQEAASRRALPVDKDSSLRKDLRSIQPTFAIDDSDSLEIDDSISLDVRQDGSTWICVHIADPSRMISPNDQLDRLAQDRVSSIFLPEKRFGMFHPSLSEKHFSLLPSRTNYALSFLIRLTSEGDVLDYEITPSIIDNVQSLTYTDADKHLTDKSETKSETDGPNSGPLRKLYDIAMTRRTWRERNNATFVDFPNPEISIKDDGAYIDVSRADSWSSPSRLMIAEYMILVGDICSQFAIKHHIPIPFRCQEYQTPPAPFDPSTVASVNGYQSPEFTTYVTELMTHWHNLSKLRPATCNLTPSPHVGLGLPAYCQATSPIRRYADLLVHFQIKAVLRGMRRQLLVIKYEGETPPIPAGQLSTVMERVEQENGELNKLSTYSQRYWILRYFERQGAERVFIALVLSVKPQPHSSPQQTHETRIQQRPHNVQILFLDLGYKMHTSLSRTLPPKCGEIVHLMVKEVDAFYNDISFTDCTNT